MTIIKLIHQMKFHVSIDVLKAEYWGLHIARFLKIARSFVVKVRKELAWILQE